MRRLVWIVGVAAAAVLLGAVSVGRAGAPGGSPTELFLSEYIEGSSNNKALEIFNGTGSAVNLSTGAYNLQIFFNGSASAGLTINLTGTVAHGDVYVVAHSSANATILAQADQTNGAGWFNGDDAVLLRKGTTVLDVIGQTGFDPGSEWGSGLVSTADNTLRRVGSVSAGDTNGTNAFDPATEWAGLATDTSDGLGAHSIDLGETAPAVVSTTPANGATNVGNVQDLQVAFDEPVAAGSAFTVTCALSGAHSVTISGGPTIYTLDPDVDFASGEICTLTVAAGNVTDADGVDPPDTMVADVMSTFTVAVCGDPTTGIHAIQGNDSVSPLVGQVQSVEGVVVGDLQGAGQFGGFYVQEEDADADADTATSEGVFVASGAAVAVGDHVRVTGTVTEFLSSGITLTQLASNPSVSVCSSASTLPTPATVALPVGAVSDLESFESMSVTMPQELTVTETFGLGRFGEVALAAGGRLFNPTAVVAPGAAANELQALNDRRRIVLDDGNSQQNIDPTIHPIGGLSAANTLRSGYTTSNLQGVLEQRFGVYRIQPTADVAFTAANERPEAPPDLGGGLITVGALNVLNYFTTTASGSICGPAANQECRGADSVLELGRQRAKLVAEIVAIDPDVAGLMEIENHPADAALVDLVASLNAETAPGTYASIATGPVGGDAIKVAVIYKPASVTPTGAHAILDSTVDPRFIDTKNRPAIAQTFTANGTGQAFTVVVNHLKSKGSDCNDVGDPDAGDGQGNCNGTRTAAAEALVDWIETDPTGSGDDDVLVIGDLNSYAMEDPIATFLDAGYANLIDDYLGDHAYSYVFQGQSGYLDHALVNPSLAGLVTGAGEWHVNADEPISLDYNVEFKSDGHIDTLFAPDQYRSSDHDPLAVGLDLRAPTETLYIGDQVAAVGALATFKAKVTSAGCSVDGGTVTFALDGTPVGSATVVSGVATLVASTAGFSEAVYDLTATFEATELCSESSDTVVFTLATAGADASGGGWTTIPGSGRVSFGFTLRRLSDGSYKGQFTLVNDEKWRLKGTLTNYVKSGKSGAADGIGTLYRWNETLGDWEVAATGVAFNIRFTDNGSGKNAAADLFGIRVGFDDAGEANPVPETVPIAIKGGEIKVG